MLMRMMSFNATAVYVPGHLHCAPDCLSRQPLNCADAIAQKMERDIQDHEDAVINGLPASDSRIEEIRKAQEASDQISTAAHYTRVGWPAAEACHPYFPVRDQLSVVNGLLLYGNRLIIPPELRGVILSRIHGDGHMGINKCRERAATSV